MERDLERERGKDKVTTTAVYMKEDPAYTRMEGN